MKMRLEQIEVYTEDFSVHITQENTPMGYQDITLNPCQIDHVIELLEEAKRDVLEIVEQVEG